MKKKMNAEQVSNSCEIQNDKENYHCNYKKLILHSHKVQGKKVS